MDHWHHFLWVCMSTFQKRHIPKRAHSKKGTFQKGHIPKRAHSKKGTFQKGNIPKRSYSILITFQNGQFPFWSNSILSIFQKGHIPYWSHSKKGTLQIKTHSKKRSFQKCNLQRFIGLCVQWLCSEYKVSTPVSFSLSTLVPPPSQPPPRPPPAPPLVGVSVSGVRAIDKF